MPITQPIELTRLEPDYRKEVPVQSEQDGELSDLDLEEVLGGLERIHFPDPITLSEPEA